MVVLKLTRLEMSSRLRSNSHSRSTSFCIAAITRSRFFESSSMASLSNLLRWSSFSVSVNSTLILTTPGTYDPPYLAVVIEARTVGVTLLTELTDAAKVTLLTELTAAVFPTTANF
ncbi:MAG: hypothetical protein JW384_02989 [Nitrosomonadaceae bacterium]|nr:hypothetical protein [Nitrosomonadaceae bacterium]